MKRKKLIPTSLLFISLLLVGSSLAGCSDLLVRNTNDSTDSTGSDEEPTDTTTPTDPTDSDDPTEEDPTDTTTPMDPTDPSDPDPDPEPTTYNVTYTASSDYSVNGLADSYEAGDTVSFIITITNEEKELSSVAWNGTVITTTDGTYSFTMPSEDVVLTITLSDVEAEIPNEPDEPETVKYTVSYDTTGEFTLSIDSGTLYEAGETVSFTVTVTNVEKKVSSVTYNGTTITPSGDIYSFTMPETDVTITIDLVYVEYSLSYKTSANDPDGLSISFVDSTITTLLYTAKAGDIVYVYISYSSNLHTINAVYANNEEITKLSSSSSMYQFTMPSADVEITIDWNVKVVSQVTYEESNDYTITLQNGATFTEGEEVSFTVTASEGKLIDKVKANDDTLQLNVGGVYSFTMPANDVVITVTTTDVTYAVSYESSSNYTISGLESIYTYGATVSFTVTPASGKYINKVSISTGGEVTDNNNNSYSFTMPAEDVIIIVTASSYSNEYMETNGYGNVYVYSSNWNRYLRSPSNVAYYLDESVTGDYFDAVLYAIDKANQLTDAVTMTTTDDSNSSYTFKVEYLDDVSYTGRNNYYYSSYFLEVHTSTITLNSYYLNGRSSEVLRFVAMHELGHTFGMIDLYDTDNPAQDYSVMGNTNYYDDYTEFDKLNIEWMYGS